MLVAAAIPLLNGDEVLTTQLTTVTIYVIALLGLNVAMGYAGLQNLATGAIVGTGALASAYFDDRSLVTVRQGVHVARIPPESVAHLLLAIVGGAAVATALGLIILLPALRLGRSAMTMVSLYMAVAFPIAAGLERLASVTGGTVGFKNVRQLVLLSDTGGDGTAKVQQEYWILLVVAGVTFLLVRRLVSSHLGRALIAVRDDEVGARALGIEPARMRILALAVLALCAGTAGALLPRVSGGSVDVNSVSGGAFDVSLAILLFAALVVGGQATLWGPVLGALALGLFQQFSGAHDFDPVWRDTIFGGLLLGAVLGAPGGVAGLLASAADRLRRRRPGGEPEAATARPHLPHTRAHDGLTVERVAVRFGGTAALDGVGLRVAPGVVHALVGANGSGKTTLLNVISGLVRPDAGTVTLDGAATTAGSAARARAGLARTFQTPRVAVRLSALENVLMGGYARYRAGAARLFFTPRAVARRDRALRAEAQTLLAAVGLGARSRASAGTLTHGERRLLEVARALLAEPVVVLLDEPAAGLGPDELAELAALIRAAAEAGTSVVLVEHNLAFVRSVATTCTVLDRGHVIGAGDPTTVLDEPAVVASFVGVAA